MIPKLNFINNNNNKNNNKNVIKFTYDKKEKRENSDEDYSKCKQDNKYDKRFGIEFILWNGGNFFQLAIQKIEH